MGKDFMAGGVLDLLLKESIFRSIALFVNQSDQLCP